MVRRYLPLNPLRAFEAAARHLSFTRAAIELNVTHAAVSQQVRALEEQLGCVLFTRVSRGLFLSLVLKSIPVGVAYAVWSGLGVVIITAIAWLLHGQKLDAWGFVGMGLIIAAFLLARSPSWKSLRRPTPW
ncbi:TPA: LysR family transcriptional regulator [Klebsiella pneumoniae]|nr:LysR family transcriptional regulator [Klebsiella pneumoniae]HBR7487291.1 LysR family transcriptional regulator [Klebsiella pneumoniae]